MSAVRIGKGGVQSTWDMIYCSRRKILYAGPEEDTTPMWEKIRGASTTNSDKILQTLIDKGRLPGRALHNANSVAPFREMDARDNGNDIELSLRLPKGGDIKKVLEILGDRLQGYVDRNPAGEVSTDELQHLLDCAHMEAMAANREQKGKQVPDLKRAIGLWLWDRSKTHPGESYERMADALFKIFPSMNGEADAQHFYRIINRTSDCITAGRVLPLTTK